MRRRRTVASTHVSRRPPAHPEPLARSGGAVRRQGLLRGSWLLVHVLPRQRQGRPTRPGDGQRRTAKDALKALASADPPAGLLGYRGKTPVGWISLGPREDFAKLRKSPVMKPVDDRPVWSIVCFVVPSEYRKQGVARELLEGAIAFARKRGVELLESYPVDREQPSAADASWFGSQRMFDDAGFDEVARRRPDRPVMRLKLAPTT